MRNILFGKAFKYYFIFSIIWLLGCLAIAFFSRIEPLAIALIGLLPSFPSVYIVGNILLYLGIGESPVQYILMYFMAIFINGIFLSSFFFLCFKVKKYIFSRGQ